MSPRSREEPVGDSADGELALGLPVASSTPRIWRATRRRGCAARLPALRSTPVRRPADQRGHHRHPRSGSSGQADRKPAGQQMFRPDAECGASWNRTSDLTLIRADRCRDIRPGHRLGSKAPLLPVPRRSRDRTHPGAYLAGRTGFCEHVGVCAGEQDGHQADQGRRSPRGPAPTGITGLASGGSCHGCQN